MTVGTPADLTRVVLIPQRGSHMKGFLKALKMLDADGLRKRGYSWFCVSAPGDDPDHAYLQAWRVKPETQGPLDRASAVPVTNSFGTPQARQA